MYDIDILMTKISDVWLLQINFFLRSWYFVEINPTCFVYNSLAIAVFA